MKKIMSILTAVSMLVSLFSGFTVFADTYTAEIVEANIVDYDGEVGNVVYESYEVTEADGVVTITMENLEKHTNGSLTEGYWTGFAVAAPEGATQFKYSFSTEDVAIGEELCAVEDIYGDGSVYGVAFITDAEAPKTFAKVQWYNELGEAVTEAVAFEMVLDVDFKYPVDPYTAEIVEANIVDYDGEVGNVVYESYEVAEADGVVTITMENLEKHTNGSLTEGYWTGFAVAAPEGATQFKYSFSTEDVAIGEELCAVEDIYGDGSVYGVAFITDAEAPKTFAKVQWYNELGEAVTEAVAFEMVLDVDFKYPVDPYTAEIVEANIVDYDGEVGNVVYESYEVAEADGVVTITMENLEKHTNGSLTEGYWTGFAVAAPEGATQFKYSFSTEDVAIGEELCAVEDIYGDGSVYGVAFITDAVAPKTFAKVQWYDALGEPVTDVAAFEMAFDVTYAGAIDVTTEDVVEAIIEDSEEPDKKVYSSYGVTATEEDGTIEVEISNKGLKKHFNGNGTEGYWTGFAVTAPEGATYAKYTFGEGSGTEVLADIDQNGTMGIAFYIDIDNAKTTATVQWFDENDDPVSNVATFEIDLSGVKKYKTSSSTSAGSVTNKDEDKDEDKTEVDTPDMEEGTVTDTEKGFADIDAGAWYYDAVTSAVEAGLMNGMSETEFAPETNLTRGMFVTILYRLAGSVEVEGTSEFADVAADAYYANAVVWATTNGIVNGLNETTFAPDNNITREQMATIIYRYAQYAKIEVEAGEDVTYTDSDSISDYAAEAVEWAKWAGLLNGNEDGSFAPQRNTTRAEAATLFVRLLALAK